MKSYNECVDALLALQFSGIKLGLDQIQMLLLELENPQKTLKFIHLAGTNGKGSTGAFISSCLSSAGFSTGFYTSPHLYSMRERFRVDGKAVSEEVFLTCANRIVAVIELLKKQNVFITFFEATTALAILIFKELGTEFVVWETGLGGRFDATNVVMPVCSVLTGIAKDHESFLGDTVVEIAGEKAGIIKADAPAFCGYVSDDVRSVFENEAKRKNTSISFISDLVPKVSCPVFNVEAGTQWGVLQSGKTELSLIGDVQVNNALLAETVLMYLSETFCFDLESSLLGMSKVTWPGRFQIIDGKVVVDGAHNPDGAAVLRSNLEMFFPHEKFTVIFGGFCDKDTQGVLDELSVVADRFVFAPIKSDRPFRSYCEVKDMLKADIEVIESISSENAVDIARQFESKIVVAGSLFLSGEVLSLPHFTINLLDIY